MVQNRKADYESQPKATNVVELQVKYLAPGMQIARDIFSSDGKILVSQGKEVSQHSIKKLQDWQIETVLIVQEKAANPLIRSEVQQFINTYNQSIDVISKAFEKTRETQEIPLEVFEAANKEIQENIPASGNIIDQLYNLPPCDDYTFRHSVNVSVITALIAGWLGYPPDIVNQMSLTGLLHDIGKSQLPQHILNQPNLLSNSDYELYKRHTHYGAELLQKNLDIPQTVKHGITAHHEREDGSGYPYALLGDKIHPYAKIVAIADLYDEGMTISREEGMLLSPYAALERLKDNIYKIEAKAAITFINRMTNFLSGNVVALTDGRIGRVVFINKDTPSRSIILINDGQIVDLTETRGVHIFHLV